MGFLSKPLSPQEQASLSQAFQTAHYDVLQERRRKVDQERSDKIAAENAEAERGRKQFEFLTNTQLKKDVADARAKAVKNKSEAQYRRDEIKRFLGGWDRIREEEKGQSAQLRKTPDMANFEYAAELDKALYKSESAINDRVQMAGEGGENWKSFLTYDNLPLPEFKSLVPSPLEAAEMQSRIKKREFDMKMSVRKENRIRANGLKVHGLSTKKNALAGKLAGASGKIAQLTAAANAEARTYGLVDYTQLPPGRPSRDALDKAIAARNAMVGENEFYATQGNLGDPMRHLTQQIKDDMAKSGVTDYFDPKLRSVLRNRPYTNDNERHAANYAYRNLTGDRDFDDLSDGEIREEATNQVRRVQAAVKSAMPQFITVPPVPGVPDEEYSE